MRLVTQLWRAGSKSQVVGLDQPCARSHVADRSHGQNCSATLIQQTPDKSLVVATVRIPVAIQAGKPGSRQWLVDRCVVLHPGVPPSDRSSVFRKLLGKLTIGEAGVGWPTPMMQEAHNGS